MKGENIMKNTQKTNIINGITIKDIKPYTEYVKALWDKEKK